MASDFLPFMTDVTFHDVLSLDDIAARIATAEHALRESLCENARAIVPLEACEWRTDASRPGRAELWMEDMLFGYVDQAYTETTVRIIKRVLWHPSFPPLAHIP